MVNGWGGLDKRAMAQYTPEMLARDKFYFQLRLCQAFRSMRDTLDLSDFQDITNPFFSFCTSPEQRQRLFDERMIGKRRNFRYKFEIGGRELLNLVVFLRSKAYQACYVEYGSRKSGQKTRCKGVKRPEGRLNTQMLLKTITNYQRHPRIMLPQSLIESRGTKLYLSKFHKQAVTSFCDKRLYLPPGVESLSFGNELCGIVRVVEALLIDILNIVELMP